MAYNRESNFIVNENQIASFLSDALKNVEESTVKFRFLIRLKSCLRKMLVFPAEIM